MCYNDYSQKVLVRMAPITKTLTFEQLKTTIQGMTKDEMAKALLNEQRKEKNVPMEPTPIKRGFINQAFDKIPDKSKDKFIDWVMTFFSKEKHGSKPWWPKKKMTPERVLSYVSDPANRFPLSPHELVDYWSIKKSLKGDINKIKDAELRQAARAKKLEKEPIYNTGDETLKNIGKDVGELTAAMVQRLEKTGMEKFFKLLDTPKFMSMPASDQAEFFDKAFAKVDAARKATAVEFAADLKATKSNMKKFLAGLVKKHIITATDIKIMTPEEIEILVELSKEDEPFIAEYLLNDSSRDNNRIKSFQSAVSHRLFPGEVRGRPKKAEQK